MTGLRSTVQDGIKTMACNMSAFLLLLNLTEPVIAPFGARFNHNLIEHILFLHSDVMDLEPTQVPKGDFGSFVMDHFTEFAWLHVLYLRLGGMFDEDRESMFNINDYVIWRLLDCSGVKFKRDYLARFSSLTMEERLLELDDTYYKNIFRFAKKFSSVSLNYMRFKPIQPREHIQRKNIKIY